MSELSEALKAWAGALMGRWRYRLRCGHAFPSLTSMDDPVAILLRLIEHGENIEAREPSDPDAVNDAERSMQETKDRPVYAYVGDLHPELGRVGLILSHEWCRRGLSGVSRCDSGGLAGRRGAFDSIGGQVEALAALKRLTMRHRFWNMLFRLEMFRSHGGQGGWESYVRGNLPVKRLNDVRDKLIGAMGTRGDRRLWTWEFRSRLSISKSDVIAVAMSDEDAKPVVASKRTNVPAYKGIELIRSAPTGSDVPHQFDDERVIHAFMRA